MGIATNKLNIVTTTGTTSSATGSAVRLLPLRIDSRNFIGRLAVVDSGTTIVDAKIQHAPTDSGPWTDLITFEQQTGSSGSTPKEAQVPVATTSVFQYLRASLTISGASPNAAITLDIYHD